MAFTYLQNRSQFEFIRKFTIYQGLSRGCTGLILASKESLCNINNSPKFISFVGWDFEEFLHTLER